jgi:cytochrome P450
MEGNTWKLWRGIFNPGFSASHISTLVPGIVDKVLIFKDILASKCKTSEMFHLEDLTLNLTLDIIGGVVM